MIRRPAFWVALCVGSVASVLFAWRTFPAAFPVISLDLRMDRAHALAAAESLAQAHGWGPPGRAHQAASFVLDDETQTFVELEGGGKAAFTRMLKDGLYEAYTWQVRRFLPAETNETLIRFDPAGRPCGFVETIKETAPGPALAPAAARELAEGEATRVWGLDLKAFTLIEQSQELRPGGRTDHTLVYQRTGSQLGEGRYRLRLVVRGDHLAELTHFVQIPEAFTRRYEKMRSANSAIAFGASIALILLYLIGGCVGGLIFLLRHHWVLWRPALRWGIGVAFLQLLAGFNAWPLVWMRYDTALDSSTFVLYQVAELLAEFLAYAALFSLTFMAAEGLSRRAFPHHPQFWRLWSLEAAPSPEILARTIGGFLLVGFDLGYLVAFYLLTTRWLGWWNPSESLAQPDVLAHYLPWFSSLARPLQAGLWEESLFRAVPLAGAALLGDRFGGRRPWIIGALLVEALVFGSGHATYAAQPSYARVVELILPSIFYGVIFLQYGLLPVILVHFAYDTVLFSLPLFVSTAPGISLDRMLLILLALTPLWVVAAARVRAGRWQALDPGLRNAAWVPPLAPQPVSAPAGPPPALAGISKRWLWLAGGSGLVGFMAWAWLTPFTGLMPRLVISRGKAIARARAELETRGARLPGQFRLMATVRASPQEADQFIWQTAGRDWYRRLLGSYLSPPRWEVRAVSFEGDVAERAEEWRVELDGRGDLLRLAHVLPEARPEASLEETAARTLADSVLRARFGRGLDFYKEVSLTPAARPARRDWVLTVADTSDPVLPQGERRVSVVLAGTEAVDGYRFVHVAEDWERAARNRSSAANLFDLAKVLGVVVACLAGAIYALVLWSRHDLPVRFCTRLTLILFATGAVALLNRWPAAAAEFSSAQPFGLQAGIHLVGWTVAALLQAAVVALLAGLALRHPEPGKPRAGQPLLVGLLLGAVGAGVLAVGAEVPAASMPEWPGYGGAATYAPWLAAALSVLPGYALRTALLLDLVILLDRGTGGWSRAKIPAGALVILLGFLVVGEGDFRNWPLWITAALLAGGYLLWLYVGFLRFARSLVPIAVGTLTAFDLVRVATQRNYPGAAGGTLLGLFLVAGLGGWWWRELEVGRASRAHFPP